MGMKDWVRFPVKQSMGFEYKCALPSFHVGLVFISTIRSVFSRNGGRSILHTHYTPVTVI